MVSNKKNPLDEDLNLQKDININELLNLVKRRKKFVFLTWVSVFILVSFYTAYKRILSPTYAGSFTILISDPLDSDKSTVNSGGVSSRAFKELALNATSSDIPTLIELLKSPALVTPIAKKYSIPVNKFIKNLSVESPGKAYNFASGVLRVGFLGPSPDKVKYVLNDISDKYLQTVLEQRQQRISDGLKFLNKQAPYIEEKTDAIQDQLSEFRKKYNIIEPTVQGSVLKSRIEEMNSKILLFESYKQKLLHVKESINNGKLSTIGFQQAIGDFDGLNFVINDADQSLINELLIVKTELAKVQSKYKPTSSVVTGLKKRLDVLQPLLKSSQIESVNSALALNEGNLETALKQREELEKKFIIQPDLIKKYEKLNQKLLIAKENLIGLVSARDTFNLEMAQRSIPWKIIADPVVNPIPIIPNIPRYLLLGFVLGAILGIISAIIKDKLDNVFHSAEAVIEEINFPLLGFLPYFDFLLSKNNPILSILDKYDEFMNAKESSVKRFYYQETLRSLSTSLRFISTNSSCPIFTVSSAIPGEGKTLINILLAYTLSLNGLRILLIDGDLRKPQISKRLKIDNISGLSNILAGSSSVIESTTEINSGFNVISSGTIPPDPVNLLSSLKANNFFKEIKESGDYDIILVDAPPLLGISDASIISKNSDGVVLIVSLENVKRNLPKEAMKLEINDDLSSKTIGVVVNSIKPNKDKDLLNPYKSKYSSYSAYQLGAYTYAKYSDGKKDIFDNEGKNEDNLIDENKTPMNNFTKIINIPKSLLKGLINWIDS